MASKAVKEASSTLLPNSLLGLNVLITGASSGIGRAIALACVAAGAQNVILFARNKLTLDEVAALITSSSSSSSSSSTKPLPMSVDIQDSKAVYVAVEDALAKHVDRIDVVINNAGLAIGAPKRFPELQLDEIDTMVDTNLKGMLYVTHAVLNAGGPKSMLARGKGLIMNVTSTTALEVPPFPGEAIYHTTKASQEAFTNSLRTELQGTNIQVVALRPGVVADTTFHKQRIGWRKDEFDGFMAGFEPLLADDVAEQAVWVLAQWKRKERVSVKALDVVPSAQRMLYVIDKQWNERNKIEDTEMKEEP